MKNKFKLNTVMSSCGEIRRGHFTTSNGREYRVESDLGGTWCHIIAPDGRCESWEPNALGEPCADRLGEVVSDDWEQSEADALFAEVLTEGAK
jgi:hypothetical protein